MTAVPGATAVTVPPDTLTTLVSLLVHVTLLFVALLGIIVAVRVSELPMFRVILVLLRTTPVTDVVVPDCTAGGVFPPEFALFIPLFIHSF